MVLMSCGVAAAQNVQRPSADEMQLPYVQDIAEQTLAEPDIAVTPPSTGVNPALQGANTPFKQHRFKVSLSENDVLFSDKGLSQYLELLYSAPLRDALTLNTALKFEMVTPERTSYLTPEGNKRCCASPGIYRYPLYLESQMIGLSPLTSKLGMRFAGQLRAGIDAPEAIGGPLQNAWHDLIGVAHLDSVGGTAFYGGIGGSVLLEGKSGAFNYFIGPSLNLTTLQRSVGVVGGVGYEAAPLTLQAFAVSERVNSRYFTEDFEEGHRVMTGLSAALKLGGAKVGDWTPVLGFSVLYDYNSVAPDLSNLRYTFVPDLQFSIPVK